MTSSVSLRRSSARVGAAAPRKTAGKKAISACIAADILPLPRFFPEAQSRIVSLLSQVLIQVVDSGANPTRHRASICQNTRPRGNRQLYSRYEMCVNREYRLRLIMQV